MKKEQRVSKRRNKTFRRWGITQKKEYEFDLTTGRNDIAVQGATESHNGHPA